MKKTLLGLGMAALTFGAVGAENLALNKAATASSMEAASLSAKAAVDGNAKTRWASASKNGEWFSVDLGAKKKIGKVVINWEFARAADFRIQTSNDGKTWADALTVKGNKKTGVQTYTFKEQDARYVRLLCDKRATGYGCSFFEFEVYER